MVRETYPVELAKQEFTILDKVKVDEVVENSKDSDNLKKTFTSHFDYGPSLLEHLFLTEGIKPNTKMKEVKASEEIKTQVFKAMTSGADFLKNTSKKGLVIQKV